MTDNVIQFPGEYDEPEEEQEPIPMPVYIQPHITLEVAPGIPPVSPLWTNTVGFVVSFIVVFAVLTAVLS